MNKPHALALIWLLVVAVLVGGLAVEFQRGLALKTDILELFPSSSDHRALRVVTQLMEGETSGKVLFFLPESSSDEAVKPVEDRRTILVDRLKATSLVDRVVSPGDETTRRKYFDYYFPHRYKLLAPSVRRSLRKDDPVDPLLTGVRRYLYGSAAPFVSELIDRDPLLLFPRLMTHWQAEMGEQFGDGESSGRMVVAQLSGDPYDVDFQKQFDQFIQSLRSSDSGKAKVTTFKWTGVIRFATTIRERMRSDLRTIGMLSTIAVVLLILLVFRSLRHLVVLVGTLGISILGALTVLFWVWPEPHIFTIVFSTSLIGVSVDYSFHFFAEQWYTDRGATARDSLRSIFPGITIGMVTTAIGYFGLTMTPLPILKQMALFSSVGIVLAFGTVVCWYPYFFRSSTESQTILLFDPIAGFLLRGWKWLFASRRIGLLAVGVLALLVLGLSQVTFNDDVRYFENVPESLIENDRSIREQTGQWNTGRFILVESNSPETVLKKLESLELALDGLRERGTIGDYRSVSPFLPSRHRQKKNFRLLRTGLLPRQDELRAGLLELGLSSETLATLFSDLRSEPESYIVPSNWSSSPVSFGLRSLWLGETDQGYTSLVLLREIADEAGIRRLLEDEPGVSYHNRLKSFTQLFGEYRWEAMLMTGLAYLLIILLLTLRYGIAGGIITAAPSVVGGLLTVAILSLMGWSFNVTHVLALLLVLGIGIDYAVFLREGLLQGGNVRGTMVAILLSALSTIFSFGFLGLSRARMLNSIGVTVFVGILTVLLLAPAVQWRVPSDVRSD